MEFGFYGALRKNAAGNDSVPISLWSGEGTRFIPNAVAVVVFCRLIYAKVVDATSCEGFLVIDLLALDQSWMCVQFS